MKSDAPITPVSWRYPLERRETAAGFASRLAALNGRPMRYFLREMCIAPRDVDRGVETAIRTVAELGAADPDLLVRFTPTRLDERRYEIADEPVDRLSINRTFFRYCPRCVAEDVAAFDGPRAARPWLRLEWTIDHIRSCDRHGILLEDATPIRRQFEPFDFAETMVGILPTIEESSERAIPAKASPFQAWIVDRLEGRRAPGNWLDDLPLYVSMTFCEALGVSSLHPPKVRTGDFTALDWAAAADEGYRIASSGEDSVRILLARLNDAQSGTRGFWGLRDTYGYAYGLLQRTVADPSYAKLRDVIRRFAIDTVPLAPGTDVLGETLLEQRVHTIRTAAKASGAHARTMRNLFVLKGLAGDGDGSGLRDHRVTVTSGEIETLVDELKGALSTSKVLAMTGIPLPYLRAMIACGHLRTVTGSNERAYAKHRFRKSDVEEMMARLFEGAVAVDETAPGKAEIAEARHAAGCSTEAILGFVFEGRLSWKGLLGGRREYGCLLVDVEEVKRLTRSEPGKSGFTKLELAKFIPGLPTASIDKLITAGFLDVDEEFSPEARRMVPVITRESAERFKEKYVSLGELTQTHGLHHKQVRMLLRRSGIEAERDADEIGFFFYDRTLANSTEYIM